ncbi:maleylpyruvate isomerase family mycothiol-dependent enzyme [Streptomyces sp. CA-106110]|uniref:maleylpyruvate isomerase family mycothiol-dependent enzyme n=1 Tax=Streptomyces sp. CA-106110 TaxID=3240044 RepID=UPI003D8B09B5
MIDHAHDLASVRDATERLLTAVSKLDNAVLAEPSRLPGWTRGHVLAHLARNADALVNVLQGRPMYVSGEARDADIERGAPRPLDIQLTDLRESAARFHETEVAPADWSRTVELRNGVTDSAARLPFRRWAEVELHHVDLGIGYELEDVPAEFADREIDFLADRFRDHPEVPGITLSVAEDPGRPVRRTGRQADSEPLTVSGPAHALLGWLSGRTRGDGLTALGRSTALPALPPL